MKKILIIDDENDLRFVLKRFLSKHGYEVLEASSGKKALDLLRSNEVDLILCDFKLDDMDGDVVLKAIKEINATVPVIIITGYSNIKTAVEVMRLGAIDYVTKPLLPEEILLTIRKAIDAPEQDLSSPASKQNGHTRTPDTKRKENGEQTYIFGDSPDFKNILKQIDLVGPTNYSVIIYGESGSGKEAIAQEIHKKSKRADKPFVAIDCGALSKELAGSELFGHEKGSFTGAVNQKVGSFELANGGTIFLDEIANLPYDVQVSLLRVVQERKMRRVGGTKDIDLDVRIIVASNEMLWNASRNGKFREDLFHRFNEFSIQVPPLRERKDDIMIFAKHFLQLANSELNKGIKGFSPEVQAIFRDYVWYGNLRELKNVVKRATLLCDEELIDVKSVPFELVHYSKLQFEPASAGQIPSTSSSSSTSSSEPQSYSAPAAPVKPDYREHSLKSAGIDAEYEVILNALKKVNFNKSKAAKLLQIDRKTLYNKIKQYRELKGLTSELEL
jgi:two-component system, NtrC family, response regulator HydG